MRASTCRFKGRWKKPLGGSVIRRPCDSQWESLHLQPEISAVAVGSRCSCSRAAITARWGDSEGSEPANGGHLVCRQLCWRGGQLGPELSTVEFTIKVATDAKIRSIMNTFMLIVHICTVLSES